MRVARTLTMLLAGLMLLQAVTGRLYDEQYRDVALIAATWIGNDWITLALAVPLLVVGAVLSSRGSIRGLLLWLGMIAYAVYNYAFYLFGASLNAFFALYVLALVTAIATLILALAHTDAERLARSFRPNTPVRVVGGALSGIGVGLAGVWMSMWAAYVFAGRSTPVEPEAFKAVAAIDLSLLVPTLTIGGVLLWRRHRWGYVIATLASIQGAIYLFVLSVNSVVLSQRGLAAAPGELVIWAPLTAVTATIAAVLMWNVRRRHDALESPHV